MSLTWERLRGEPNRAYAPFESYLSLGPGRSLAKLARTGVASLSYLKKLSTQWHWPERAAQWQGQVSAATQVAEVDLVAQARERHLRDALALQQLARAQLARWVRRGPQGEVWLAKQLTPAGSQNSPQVSRRSDTSPPELA